MSLPISPAQIVQESRSPLLAAPTSWPRRRLEEVASVFNGFAFKSEHFVPTGGVPLIRIRDIFSEGTEVGYRGEYEDRYLVQPGDLLVGMDGDFRCTRWRGPVALLNQRVCKITPDPEWLDIDFLTYLLPGYLQAIHDVTSSMTVTHLSSRDIAEIPVPVPSLDEQRRLAGLLSVIEKKQNSARSHTKTARGGIDRLRRAVLAAACSGRLTDSWRLTHPHIDPANSIVESIQRARSARVGKRFTAIPAENGGDLPDGWCWVALGSLVDVATGATPLRSNSRYYGGRTPWVTSRAVNSAVITIASENITNLALKETNAQVFPAGTLLVAMYGEGQTRGRVAELGISAATNQALAALLFDTHSDPLRAYLRLFLLENYETIRALSFGGVQPNLSLGLIRTTMIPLAPLEEQAEIVRLVDELFKRITAMSARIEAADRSAGRVERAVLAKALRGELLGARANGV